MMRLLLSSTAAIALRISPSSDLLSYLSESKLTSVTYRLILYPTISLVVLLLHMLICTFLSSENALPFGNGADSLESFFQKTCSISSKMLRYRSSVTEFFFKISKLRGFVTAITAPEQTLNRWHVWGWYPFPWSLVHLPLASIVTTFDCPRRWGKMGFLSLWGSRPGLRSRRLCWIRLY